MENYIEECFALGLEPLDEAGGLVSWIKRMYTAKDDSVVSELNLEIDRGIRDEDHRKKTLKDIDGFIEEAEKAESGGKLQDFMHGALPGMINRGKARDSGAIRSYIAALKKIRARVVSAKIKE